MAVTQDQALIKLVTGRQQTLENDKANFNDRMQDVADYVCPHRDDIRGTLQKGEKKGTKIYDGTAPGAAVLATDGIHGYHVSPAFPWFKYQMNRKQVNQVKAVREWLDEIEFNMYMALNRSNFYSEMWPFIYDGFTIGTAPIYPEEDLAEARIIFEAVHPGEVFIAENKYGEVDILHRKRKMAARQLYQMFGDDCPEPVKTANKNAPFSEFEIIHAVFPREDHDDRSADAKKKRFASVWIMSAGNHICRVSGFGSFPYHVWRYMRSGKEPYGLSPAHLAMADIKGVNLMGKTLLGVAQLALDPAYNVPAYLQGKVQLRPRGLNYVREGTTDKISPINTGKDYPVGIDREQAKQNSIKERFHVDTFLMLSQLKGRGQRTAYEVSELMAEKAAVLGAELGPLNTELDHILDHVYEIELAAGRMPKPPDILYELAAEDPHLRFDPVYMGPLAQAQRERFAKDGIRKFFMEITPLINAQAATGSTELLDNFDLDEAGRYLADSNGIPAVMIRDKETVKAMRDARIQAQQEAVQQAQMEEFLQGLKTVSEADKNMGGGLRKGLSEMMGGGASAAA